MRGDYANLTPILDLTLSRIDAGFFTGTAVGGRPDGAGTAVGPHHRPVAQPVNAAARTAGNPLVAPYRWDQGPLTCG